MIYPAKIGEPFTIPHRITSLRITLYIPCTFRHLIQQSICSSTKRECVHDVYTTTHYVSVYLYIYIFFLYIVYIVHALQSEISTLFRYLKFILISLSYASLQCKYFVVLCNGTYDYDNMVLYAHLPSLSPFHSLQPMEEQMRLFSIRTCSLFVSLLPWLA